MSDLVRPGSLNWTSILIEAPEPSPISFFGLPEPCLRFLARAALAGVVIWFWRNRAPAAPPPLVPGAPGAGEEGLRVPPSHLAIAAGEIGVVWNAAEVAAAIRGMIAFMEAGITEDGAETRYPSLDQIQAGDLDLVVPKTLVRLQQLLPGLPQPQRLETLRRACPRFSDALEDVLVLHTNPEVFSDPCELTKESTKNWIIKLIITTKALCLIWNQLNLRNQQLCKKLREECFEEVAGQSMQNILQVACLFSEASWSASHILYVLPIFDALAEVLKCNIQDLPSSRSNTIRTEVDDIFQKMVNCLVGILEDTASDMHINEESAIYPATYFLIQALKFLCRTPVLTKDHIHRHNLCICWVSKLEEDAERKFRNEKDRQYISILNNISFIWQKRNDPAVFLSGEQAERFNALIQQYISRYLNEYWDPLLKHLNVDSLRRPRRSSLDRFTQDFDIICERQRNWKVQTALKKELRARIESLIHSRYDRFFNELQTSGRSVFSSFFPKRLRKEEKKIYTKEDLIKEIKALFER